MNWRHLICFLFLFSGWFIPEQGFIRAETTSGKINRLDNAYSNQNDKNWVVRAFAALALKDIPDSRSAEIIAKIFRESKPDEYLISFALFSLSQLPPEVLQGGLDKETIDVLIKKWLKQKNDFNNTQILQILGKVLGKGEQDTSGYWGRRWEKESKSYEKKQFVKLNDEPESKLVEVSGEPSDEKTVSVIMRLSQLQKEGLDLVLVVDVTGSMGPYIDQVRQKIRQMYRIFKEVSPSFRFGIVGYWDVGKVLLPLSGDETEIIKKVKQLGAAGGDDWAEGVEKGLESALSDEKMAWRNLASKVIVIIGDASPHAQDLEKTYKIANDAHNNPSAAKNETKKIVITGKKANEKIVPVTPYVIHAMVVGDAEKLFAEAGTDASVTSENRNVLNIFSKIAENGGGVGFKLEDQNEVVQQIMLLTFGKEWENEVSQFLEVFLNVLTNDEENKK